MFYINIKNGKEVETINETESRKEANRLVTEYRMAGYGWVYVSSRCTKEWRERK